MSTLITIEVDGEYLVKFVHSENYKLLSSLDCGDITFITCEINAKGLQELEANNVDYETDLFSE